MVQRLELSLFKNWVAMSVKNSRCVPMNPRFSSEPEDRDVVSLNSSAVLSTLQSLENWDLEGQPRGPDTSLVMTERLSPNSTQKILATWRLHFCQAFSLTDCYFSIGSLSIHRLSNSFTMSGHVKLDLGD
jgi:hypothetical protein